MESTMQRIIKRKNNVSSELSCCLGYDVILDTFHTNRSSPLLSLGMSDPLEKIHIRELLHLIHIALRLDDFLIVEEDPGFLFLCSFCPLI